MVIKNVVHLIVQDQCALWRDVDLAVGDFEVNAALGLAFGLVADDFVLAIGDVNAACTVQSVERDVDVSPGLARYLATVDVVGHEANLTGQEFQIAAHHVGTAHVEGRMSLAHGNQVLVVLHHLGIAFQVAPVQMIDLVRTVEAVVHALLVAQHFLTTEHEGHTL